MHRLLLARTTPALVALFLLAGCGCHGNAYALTARDQYRSGEIVVVRVHNETDHEINVDVHMALLRRDRNKWVSAREKSWVERAFLADDEYLLLDMPQVVGVPSCDSAVFKYHLGPELRAGQYRLVVDRWRTNTFEVLPHHEQALDRP
jgi:hypothetical protein